MAKDYSSIIVSSRVRLSRCLSDVPFPSKMTKAQGQQVIAGVRKALPDTEFDLYKMTDLPKNEAYILQEKHLISPDLIEGSDFGAVCINTSETVAVMINEEDHLREQCILPGLNIEKAYSELNKVDNLLCKHLDIAFDANLGFLTSCITNVGTGLRVSVMLFLPALTLTGKMQNLAEKLKRNGMAVRGAYGEATEHLGYLYQISNERTIGHSEQEYIAQITAVVLQICDMEIDARKELLQTREAEVKDIVGRAYGILTNCYLLPCSEFMKLAGEVKMGIALNILRMKDSHIIDKLLDKCTPYTICTLGVTITSSEDEQKFRAAYVANILRTNRIK